MAGGTISSRYFVLGLLAQQPMSGYDVKRFLKRLSWLIGSPSFGGLYPTLHALLEDGLATVRVVPREGKPPRKIYRITRAGRQVLQEWMDRPPTTGPSLKAFVMHLVLAGHFSRAGLMAYLQQRRSQVAGHRAALDSAAGSLDEEAELGQRMAVGYGLAVATAELAWLDRTLDELSHQPLPVEVVQGKGQASGA